MGVLLTLLCIALSTSGAILLTYRFDRRSPFWVRLFQAIAIGMVIYSLLAYAFASLWGLNLLTVAIAALGSFFWPYYATRSHRKAALTEFLAAARSAFQLENLRKNSFVAGYCILLAAFLARIFYVGVREEDGAILTSMADNYADLALHLGIINGFAFGDNFPPAHPAMAATKLSYPFLVDFTVSTYLKLGASYTAAFFIQNIVLVASLVALFGYFAMRLTGSKAAGLLSPILFFFNGGLGWTLIFSEAKSKGGLLSLLGNLEHDYTSFEELYRWNNSLVYWLVPMRSMLLAVPIMCTIWLLWWSAIENWRSRSDGSQTRTFVAAGLLTGLMPLVHAHSFMVLMLTAFLLALIYWRPKLWLLFAIIASTLAMPQILMVTAGSEMKASNFVAWEPGWTKGEVNFVWYWFQNSGIFIPLLAIALVYLKRTNRISKDALYFFAPFALWFIVPNLWKLAPWTWDNIKVLYIWFLASIPFVAALVAALWSKGKLLRGASVVATLLLILASVVDLYRYTFIPPTYEVFSKDDRVFSDLVRNETSEKALILSAPIHNSHALLAGRRLVMAYAGTIWTHGMNADATDRDIRAVFEGSSDALEVLNRRGVDAILVTPKERSWANDAKVTINEAFLSQFPAFEHVSGDQVFKLYKVRK